MDVGCFGKLMINTASCLNLRRENVACIIQGVALYPVRAMCNMRATVSVTFVLKFIFRPGRHNSHCRIHELVLALQFSGAL